MAEEMYAMEEQSAADQLASWIGHPNIATDLDDATLAAIGERCRHGFQEDELSMEDWSKAAVRGMKLAKQVYEAKNTPWAGAASVKLPLISTATLHFGATAYAELIKPGDVVQSHLPGLSPLAEAIKAETPEEAAAIAGQMGAMMQARAKRVERYMNWQLMDEIPDWEADMDRLLHMLPVIGCIHKKTLFDATEGRPDITLCDPKAIVINQGTRSLEKARRVSERLPLMSENDLVERTRAGIFIERTYQPLEDTQDGKLYEFIEMHRWYDLDGDGYEEPYIVTVESKTWKVARIVARYEIEGLYVDESGQIARIEPVQHYTKYEFFPDLEGGYWSMGWAHFLEPLTASANGIVNQLMDAGTLSNVRPGFMSQTVKLQEGGVIQFKVGEYKRVKAPAGRLADAFYHPPIMEPSQVLFALLGFISDSARELSAVTDVGMGDIPPNTPAATVLSMIEQGQKVFSGIHKRIYRAMRSEFVKLYKLNAVYTDPQQYQTLLNQPADPRQDFNSQDMDVMPTASPELSSRHQRRAQAEAMRYAAYGPAGMPVPGVDEKAVAMYAFEQITPDFQRFFPEPSADEIEKQNVRMQAEDLMMQESVKQTMSATKKAETDIQETRANIMEKAASIELKKAQVIKTLAEAQAQDLETDAVQSGLMEIIQSSDSPASRGTQ